MNWWRVSEEVEVSSVARDDSERLYVKMRKRGGTWGAFKNVDIVLRSKGLKDATCVDWFGDDRDCSVGSPPEGPC